MGWPARPSGSFGAAVEVGYNWEGELATKPAYVRQIPR